ncbi:MAG TPA: pyrroloquinoline quinone precursor peptide PqqA [Burkholderiaceae bacterium]|nr:pyrroloquinoline quinone precursor peptide PqqA [Burkholderiaceae bacterium]
MSRPLRSIPFRTCNDRPEENAMTWETPAAIDYRFGFEITLYIANR